jgi:hypothetical protein
VDESAEIQQLRQSVLVSAMKLSGYPVQQLAGEWEQFRDELEEKLDALASALHHAASLRCQACGQEIPAAA